MESQIIDTQSLNFFNYASGSVRVYGTPQNPLFDAKDVCDILNYKNTSQTINKNVDSEDYTYNSHPHSILINESGLYSLLLRSKKKEAKPFKRWVTSEVLPAIRKTGSYTSSLGASLVQQKTPQMLILETVRLATEIFDKVGYDERDRLLIHDLTRSAINGSSSGRIQEIIKQNDEWSISRRLSEHYDKKTYTKDKCLAFGRLLAKQYRLINNNDPPKRRRFVRGTVQMVNCYYLSDWEEFGDKMIEEYFNLGEERALLGEDEALDEDKEKWYPFRVFERSRGSFV